MTRDRFASALVTDARLRSWVLADLCDELLDGAECRFDPELHDGPDPVTTIEHPDARAAREDVAREICASCSVRDLCLEYAVRTLPERGVWAGFTADQILAIETREAA